MNTYCNKCNSNLCDGHCRPAKYGCDFDIQANPYDSGIWNVTINGATTRVKIPKINETDTKLSTSFSAATLNFDAEKHKDTISGSQLGSLINLEDLRDVDAENPDAFDLMAYHPYCDECGEGCTPKDARWVKYHIPDEQSNVIEPDEDGYYHVLSLSDCGGIQGARIPKGSEVSEVRCVLDNLMKAVSPFEGQGQVTSVPSGAVVEGMDATFNPNTGEFRIDWKDFVSSTQVAHGSITGRMNATNSFDYSTGVATFNVSSIYYDTITYTIDTGGSYTPITITLWGCFPGAYDLSASHTTLDNEGLRLFQRTTPVSPGNSYTFSLGITFTGSISFTVNPHGGTSSWINALRIYNDWDTDRDVIAQIRYRNPLNWEIC